MKLRGCLTFLYYAGLLTLLLFSAKLYYSYYYSPEDKECAIQAPRFLESVFEPLVSCDICRDVTGVKYISNIEPEIAENLLRLKHPFVVTDATKNWTALNTFSFDFFRDLFKTGGNCQFFPYKTKFRNIKEFFATVSQVGHDEPWYVGWSNCDSSTARVLRQYYDQPYPVPSDCEPSKTDWIFIGLPGYGAHMHVDHVTFMSWQSQIKGRKKWIFRPPLECYFKCPKREFEVILEPGHTLFVDTNAWYHGTLVLDGEVSISIGTEFDF